MIAFNRTIVIAFLLCAAVFLPNVPVSAARQGVAVLATAPESAPLTVDEIVRRMDERNRERAAALRQFEGTRIYRMQYNGFFGARDAEVVVAFKGSLKEKQFTVESQSGSKFIIDYVIKKLLDGESEASTDKNRQRTALNSDNYDFTLADFDTSSGRQYVLNVIPKTDEKFLYRGKIWVDSKDFAVTRIEAEPAKSPSMWVKKTVINHRYEKLGDFWLPVENNTDSVIRLGGHALLSIEYKDYKLTDTTALNLRSSANEGVLH
jgi:hypothetical protein